MKKPLLGIGALLIGFLSGYVIALKDKPIVESYETVTIQPMIISLPGGSGGGFSQPGGGGSCGG